MGRPQRDRSLRPVVSNRPRSGVTPDITPEASRSTELPLAATLVPCCWRRHRSEHPICSVSFSTVNDPKGIRTPCSERRDDQPAHRHLNVAVSTKSSSRRRGAPSRGAPKSAPSTVGKYPVASRSLIGVLWREGRFKATGRGQHRFSKPGVAGSSPAGRVSCERSRIYGELTGGPSSRRQRRAQPAS